MQRASIALLVTAGMLAGLAGGSTTGQSFGKLSRDDVAAACGTGNPYVAVVCTDQAIVYQDTAGDRPHFSFGFPDGARQSTVGAIWGLAYSSREHALYAAATHRRGTAFGAGGPGAIYRIDLATGEITQPIDVPNAGIDRHPVNVRGDDSAARDFAGKTGLGDIDLSDDERELFAVNLEDRRIYRFDVASGALIGAFDTGGDQEPFAEDSRPFGLAYRAGTLYHAVVNSAESTRRDADLGVVVYASRPDGGGLQRVYDTALDQPRPIVPLPNGRQNTAWQPWLAQTVVTRRIVYAQPIASDLAFTADGDLAIGLKDRFGDMVYSGVLVEDPAGRANAARSFGLAVGDLLVAPRAGDGWGAAVAYNREMDRPLKGLRNALSQGGLAAIADDVVATSSIASQQGYIWTPSTHWLAAAGRTVDRVEQACAFVQTPPHVARERSGAVLAAPLRAPLRHNGEPTSPPPHVIETSVLAAAPGDVERLCAPNVLPSPTASLTPLISPTPSSTRTPSPTRTQTPTPTDTDTATPSPTPSPTREPSPIYLPITLSEPRCLPIHPKLDILLVLDASTSMRELTRAGRPKIDAAVAAARDFLARLNLAADGDHAGLVSFNAAATLDSPLTADRAALDAALGRVALAQFTRIDLGLDAAAAELAGPRRRADATAAVVLLTDGRSNPVPVSEAERAAGVVKAFGARLFTIGLGQDVDAEALRAMASQAADYFEAPDGEDLGAIYGAISAALPCAPNRTWPGASAPGSP